MPSQYKKKSMPLKDLSLISESLTSWLLANVRLRTVWIELSFVNCTENRCKNSWESLWIYAPVSRLKLSTINLLIRDYCGVLSSAQIHCTGARDSGFLVHVRLSIERVLKAKQQSVVERIRDGMEFVRGGISLRNKGEETRFKLNIPLSSYKAIKGIQLATIDGLPLKGNSFIRWKRDISPGNGFRAISLIVEGEWMTASLHMSHTIQCNNLK